MKFCRHDFVVCFFGALRDNNSPPHGNCTNHRDQIVASEQLAASPSGEFELSFLSSFLLYFLYFRHARISVKRLCHVVILNHVISSFSFV